MSRHTITPEMCAHQAIAANAAIQKFSEVLSPEVDARRPLLGYMIGDLFDRAGAREARLIIERAMHILDEQAPQVSEKLARGDSACVEVPELV